MDMHQVRGRLGSWLSRARRGRPTAVDEGAPAGHGPALARRSREEILEVMEALSARTADAPADVDAELDRLRDGGG